MKRVAFAAAVALTLVSKDARADQEKTVQWNDAWPRARWWEVVNVFALTGGSALINQAPAQPEANWKGPILLDAPARRLFRATTFIGQKRAAVLSDYLYRGMVVTPYVVDNFIAALGVHQNADVALQMTLIDMQSLGLSGVITLGLQHMIGRQRPYVSGCKTADGTDDAGFSYCGGADDFKSFWSGHTAAMFTMAGLTCVHHQHLPLYGGGAPDALACAVMTGLAGVGSVMRVVSDRHWLSDVLFGGALGMFNGYVVPLLLHYGVGWNRPAIPTTLQTSFGRVVPVPQVYEGGAGLGFSVF
ncbi:MAG: phosphatase PAP2 family protein [Labilithrix sp.]|nr:phosphatase PAP2 family protein [Labilithrix sp.]MCW5817586.1 phosphatase PAP2 family protein [Labilithrix sp.]